MWTPALLPEKGMEPDRKDPKDDPNPTRAPTKARCEEDGAFGGGSHVGRCLLRRGHAGDCEFERFGENGETMDDFTLEMLDKASNELPHKVGEATDVWWENRKLDEGTIFRFALKMKEVAKVPVSVPGALVVGMMVGLELGKLYCDPSFALAHELAHPEDVNV